MQIELMEFGKRNFFFVGHTIFFAKTLASPILIWLHYTRSHSRLRLIILSTRLIKLSIRSCTLKFLHFDNDSIRVFLILIPLQGFRRSDFNESSRRKTRPHYLLVLLAHMVTGNHFVTKFMTHSPPEEFPSCVGKLYRIYGNTILFLNIFS